MAYDRLAESLRLIDGGPVAGAEPLTRRRRHLPVAVDVDGELAVTVFLRRAHGGAEWEFHALSKAAGQWRVLGGGGHGRDPLDVLTRVPTRDELGGYAQSDGAGGGVLEGWAGTSARSERWMSYAIFMTTVDVAGVSIEGRRTIARPAHGRIVVVWSGHRGLPVSVMGRGGEVLDTLLISSAGT